MIYPDQLGRQVEIPHPPRRIVSLVPSQTELLFYLGLEQEVKGITRFCIHPNSWFQNKERVGGTKQLHMEKIRQLQPDLVIANREENVREQIELLAKNFPVWISDVDSLGTALDMIASIGRITGKSVEAMDLCKNIRQLFSGMKKPANSLSACYLIWRDPYMTVGGDTFIHDMMGVAGFNNLFGQEKRYPVITINQLKRMNCDVLMLSSEPYPFKEKHIKELQLQLPDTKILLVDGELFSWYGSRLLKAPAYFEQLHQQVLSLNNAAGT